MTAALDNQMHGIEHAVFEDAGRLRGVAVYGHNYMTRRYTGILDGAKQGWRGQSSSCSL